MEESITRKRHLDIQNLHYTRDDNQLKIYEEVFLLSCLRSDYTLFCDALSLSLRVAALSDLGISNIADLKDEIVKVNEDIIEDPILLEFYDKIKSKEMKIKDLIISINGESFSRSKMKLHIKKLRERVAKKLEEKGMIRYGKNKYKLFKGKMSVDEKIKSKLTNQIIEYLSDKSYCLRKEVIISCLMYCGGIKPLFFSLPQNKMVVVQAKLDNIRKRFLDTIVKTEPPERLVYSLVKTLLRL